MDWDRARSALRYIGLGWYVAICLVAGLVLGLWADDWLGTRPLFMLVGLFLGIAGAFLGLIRVISRVVKGDNSAGGKAKENK
ncbi:MAG: AtpZ/AtpI family protein [Dehalococcoidia bacterium]|nr:AtpZ/AtpI family protein [Dehalococcoidia bacterium]